MFKWILFTLIVVCGCYYMWPKQTVKTIHKITSTTEAATRAGYATARK